MITRIEIDGFKSFVQFGLDVRPCTVLMGTNGAGKSNLLDALDLVRRVLDGGLQRALGGDNPRLAVRGLFHRGETPEGPRTAREFTIKVGMIVPSDYGPLPVVARVVVRGGEGTHVRLNQERSALWVSSLGHREWMERLGLPADLRRALASARDQAVGEGQGWYPLGGEPDSFGSTGEADDSTGTVASVGRSGRLRALLMRETRTWERFALEASAMRAPYGGTPYLPLRPDGANLATVLHRLGENGLRDMEADLAALIPEASGVRTLYDERRGEYDFDVRFRHTGWTAPPMLSDGTLRVLALLAAWYDDSRKGLLAVDEVENGLHPTRIAELVRRLRRDVDDFPVMAANGVQTVRSDLGGFRQLLVSTHSPVLLSALRDEAPGTLVFLEQGTLVDPETRIVSTVTRARPVRERSAEEEPGDTVPPGQVQNLLESLGQVVA
ncbi:AAA family ATPase [Streptomyces sp. NPDC047002]|uniref:AAA family ATPase n=1 Tax=Streptomyces sp. NPDC047002 TaxID=3155475 RepID=UPI0034565B78